MNKKLTKEEFLEKLKTDKDFNKKYGRKDITEGKQVLPPCHYGFQVYTRELSREERFKLYSDRFPQMKPYKFQKMENGKWVESTEVESMEEYDVFRIPTRAISLMWSQRSVDTFLGLPFNIASYGLLLEIIAKAVNMVPDELIGNLGDTHLYSNHVEQAKEQIGRELTHDEIVEYFYTHIRPETQWEKENDEYFYYSENNSMWAQHSTSDIIFGMAPDCPKRTREPFELPKLKINTEFWPTEGGECGVGPIDAITLINGFSNDDFCKSFLTEDLQLINYQSHPTIKAPLSN